MSQKRLRLVSYMTPGLPVSLFVEIARLLDAELILEQRRSGPAADEDPFVDGGADLAWMCSTGYLDMASRPVQTAKLAGVGYVPQDPDTSSAQYFSDVVVPASSKVAILADLKGLSIGCNDEVSLSGHYSLLLALHSLGVTPAEFAELRFTGGHQRSFDELGAGRVDSAAVDSITRTARSVTDPDVAALRVVERIGPFPSPPLVARRDLDAGVLAEVNAALLASNDSASMRAELDAAPLSHFATIGDDHRESVRLALAAANL